MFGVCADQWCTGLNHKALAAPLDHDPQVLPIAAVIYRAIPVQIDRAAVCINTSTGWRAEGEGKT